MSGAKGRTYGPLKGQRAAILGASRHGELARRVAAKGAEVLTSICPNTTMLVFSENQPFGDFFIAYAYHRRAEEIRHGGPSIEIVMKAEVRRRLEGYAAA